MHRGIQKDGGRIIRPGGGDLQYPFGYPDGKVWADLFPKDGLHAYYKLDETSGTTASDSHGDNDGTATDEQVFTSEVSGIINTGADFSNDDEINIANHINIHELDAGSVSLWFKANSFPSPKAGYFTSRPNNSDDRFYIHTVDTDLMVRIGDTDRVTVKSGLNTDQWYHVVLVGDSGTLYAYLDGELEAENSYNTAGGSGFDDEAAIGTIGSDYSDATVDEVGIWYRALSQEDVQTLYSDGEGLEYS